jgi:8-oxo-dGTP pyrophosphatase MutT (NUDIX family)
MTETFRTVLEQKIRERRQTFEEFVAYAETYAREHNEPGTLGVRHLQRLVAGRRSDGRPLGPVRPETARLLEHIFRLSIDELLSAPDWSAGAAGSGLGQSQALRVAVAVVVKENEVLVVCRRGEDANGISWQFPAGIVKPNGQSTVVAVRETYAETGVHCVALEQVGSRIHPVTGVLCDYVLCEYLTGDARNADVVENVGVTWVDKAELARFIPKERIYPPVLDLLELDLESAHV